MLQIEHPRRLQPCRLAARIVNRFAKRPQACPGQLMDLSFIILRLQHRVDSFNWRQQAR
jgi:hypothetical protein